MGKWLTITDHTIELHYGHLLYLWGLLIASGNADAIMLRFNGITALYEEYVRLHFLRAQGEKNWKEIFQNMNSVIPECSPLPVIISCTFCVFKSALIMLLEGKQTSKTPEVGGQSHKRWSRLWQECQCGGQICGSRKKAICWRNARPLPHWRRLHWNKTKAGSPREKAVKFQIWSQLRVISWTPGDAAKRKEPISREKTEKDVSREKKLTFGIQSAIIFSAPTGLFF